MAGTLLLPKAALIRPLLNSSRPLCVNSGRSPTALQLSQIDPEHTFLSVPVWTGCAIGGENSSIIAPRRGSQERPKRIGGGRRRFRLEKRRCRRQSSPHRALHLKNLG
jgi:hypothetical protein